MATHGVAGWYGVFHVGTMRLALPLEHLREVVPLGPLAPLPCPVPSVAGGLSLRGSVIPVVDPRPLFALQTDGPATNVVVIVHHEARVLGMLATGIGAVVHCSDDDLTRFGFDEGRGAVLVGALKCRDDGEVVNVLSAAALVSLDGIPTALDTSRDGRRPPADRDASTAGAMWVLLRCGAYRFGIRSDTVHTTIGLPEVHSSPVAGGYCLGAIKYSGVEVPLVDLAALCDLGCMPAGRPFETFLVRYPDGYVAFAVDKIVDVVAADVRGLVAVPPESLSRPEWFTGALPTIGLPPHSDMGGDSTELGYTLLLDGDVVRGSDELRGLARLNVPVSGRDDPVPSRDPVVARGGGERCTVVTYDLGTEVATPMDQVHEILPWSPAPGATGQGGEGTRPVLYMSRGRAIPVYSLSALLGLEYRAADSGSGVLVVRDAHGLIGFCVARLVGIDQADRAEIDGSRGHRPMSSAAERTALTWLPSVTVGSGGTARLLSMVDLTSLANELRTLQDIQAESSAG